MSKERTFLFLGEQLPVFRAPKVPVYKDLKIKVEQEPTIEDIHYNILENAVHLSASCREEKELETFCEKYLSHEIIHYVLHKIEGPIASMQYDNVAYEAAKKGDSELAFGVESTSETTQHKETENPSLTPKRSLSGGNKDRRRVKVCQR